MPPMTTLSMLLQPIFDGGRDRKLQQWATKLTAIQRQNQGILPRIADASLAALHRQKLAAEFCHRFNSRLRPPLSPDRGRSHLRRSDMSEPSGTTLFASTALFSPRFLAFHRLVQVLVLIIRGFPLWSFHSLVNSLAEGVPVLVHERWLPTPSPMRTQSKPVRSFPNNSSPEVCREALVSTALNCLSPSMILRRLISSNLGTIMLTGLSPSFRWFVTSLSELIELSHIPFGVVRREIVASRRFVLSCITKTLFWVLPMKLAATCTPHSKNCTAYFRTQTRPIRCCLQARSSDNEDTRTTR